MLHGGSRDNGGLSVPVPDAGAGHSTADGQIEVLAGVVSTQGSHPWASARASRHLHRGRANIGRGQEFLLSSYLGPPHAPHSSTRRRCMLACTRWQWERGMMDQSYTTAEKPGILLFYCSMPSHTLFFTGDH